MRSYSRVIIIGNLVRDPELRYTASGKAVLNMRVAVNHRVRKGDEVKEEVSFFDIVGFGKIAQLAKEYLAKGSAVFVDGSLRERRWENQDGHKKSKIEIIAENIRFLSPRQEVEEAEDETIFEDTEEEA